MTSVLDNLRSNNVRVASDLGSRSVVSMSSLLTVLNWGSILALSAELRLASKLARSSILRLLGLAWSRSKDWLSNITWVRSSPVAETVLQNVGNWSLTRSVISWHVWIGSSSEHVNAEVDLTDLLLSVVEKEYPVGKVWTSGE